jgi:hypothetical protein
MRVTAGTLCLTVAILCCAPLSATAGDNPLPFGKKSVPDEYRGDLQLPLGISFGYSRMTDAMVISDFAVALGGQPLPPGVVVVDQADHATNTYLARFDAWVLPFVNVYAFAAKLNGEVKNVAVKVNPIPGLPVPPLPPFIGLDFDGHLYGVGTTIAAGYRSFFASYDINREWVTLSILSNTAPALSQSIRTGFRTKIRGDVAAFYVGGFHLSLRDADLTGSDIFPGVPGASFSLTAKPTDPWNMLVGATVPVVKHLTVTAEAGLGTRKQFTIMPGVRF